MSVLSAMCCHADEVGCSIARDINNNRNIIVYSAFDETLGNVIRGKILNNNGEIVIPEFMIADTTSGHVADGSFPSVAHDSVNHRYLVTWNGGWNGSYDVDYDIFGLLVNEDGTIYDTNTDGIGDIYDRFIILYPGDLYTKPRISYDDTNHKFFMVWQNSMEGTVLGQLLNVDGSLYGSQIAISSNCYYHEMSVAYDSINHRFLVVWSHNDIPYTDGDIYGQLVNADGSLYDRNGGRDRRQRR